VRLLNPGPVTLTAGVRTALGERDLCHREPEYTTLQGRVRSRLAAVYAEAGGQFDTVLITGSGTAAVEAMLASLVPRHGKALVIANGIYGERMATILDLHGRRTEVVQADWLAPIDLDGASRAIERDPRITHVVVVHHETTTGRLNDLGALADLCRERRVRLLVDAVSSFGGEAIDFERWPVDACASTANKCLHGAPGVAFVLVRKPILETRTSACGSLYLDLFRHYAEQRRGYPAFTPAVQSMAALDRALDELDAGGGWSARHDKYAALSRALRTGLKALGIQPLLDDEGAWSSMLTAFRLPDGIRFDWLFSSLKSSGFVIYPGQQFLKDRMFRIAVMGDLHAADIDELVEAEATALAPAGHAMGEDTRPTA
jgi:2-aminoethylphosphonate-pyruvate transaminase